MNTHPSTASPSDGTSKKTIIKFALLCALLVGYFAYLSIKFDIATGGAAALLTWSFFVLCTPIADAGFLLDFPLRLLFGIQMVISEIVVWIIAISINAGIIFFGAHYYQTTALTKLLHKIITTPMPYWGIILLSMAGTFISVKMGDEVMDVIHHHKKGYFHSRRFKWVLATLMVFALVIVGYYEMIASLGIDHIIEGTE